MVVRFVFVPLIVALIKVPCPIMIYIVKVMGYMFAIAQISKHLHRADQT